MKDKIIYGIFSGAYSDWQVHGYMTNREDAEKYCALKNSNHDDDDYFYNDYYIVNINHMYTDIEDVELKYYHEVIFDFDEGMRDEPNRYDYYIGEKREPSAKYNTFKNGSGWVSFDFNCETRKKAEKIAQDKYYQFLAYKSEFGIKKAAELIGASKII